MSDLTCPTVIGYAHPQRRGKPVFWCVFCSREHEHGYGQGHRSPHCARPSLYNDKASPFTLDGYDLRYENLSEANYLNAVRDAAKLHRWADEEVRRLRTEAVQSPPPLRNTALNRAMRLDRDAVLAHIADVVATARAAGVRPLYVFNLLKGNERRLERLAQTGTASSDLTLDEAVDLLKQSKADWVAVRALETDIRRSARNLPQHAGGSTAYGLAYRYLDATSDSVERYSEMALKAGVPAKSVTRAARQGMAS